MTSHCCCTAYHYLCKWEFSLLYTQLEDLISLCLFISSFIIFTLLWWWFFLINIPQIVSFVLLQFFNDNKKKKCSSHWFNCIHFTYDCRKMLNKYGDDAQLLIRKHVVLIFCITIFSLMTQGWRISRMDVSHNNICLMRYLHFHWIYYKNN